MIGKRSQSRALPTGNNDSLQTDTPFPYRYNGLYVIWDT
jgi:hypothetical protein